MAATDTDDSDLSDRVECHEHNEDGWCYWIRPGLITPEGDRWVWKRQGQSAGAANG
jgi:hypothetical protein